eukprot:TRINITY_DN5497_c0_g1_i2.p1 TRINITY_DN5497_c0_g1~~TRINITY_DN5497_c0_g1_i2.p1  ORF type:complete len:513 (-),score=134.46 TRINITY_DN5497_c0_g1_i2:12-1454(-)
MDDETFDYDATEEGRVSGGGGGGGGGGASVQLKKGINEPSFNKLNLTVDLSGGLKEQNRKDDAKRLRHKEKASRATTEQVIDPRTRMILYKMLNNNLINEIHGCISTGKEANVYYATTAEGKQMAIKIYKTSILVFKDRERYVSGEFRFRRGYCKSNPRKMVKVWAEKEMKNLARLNAARIPSPTPVYLRSNVLMMDFIGKAGWPAPRLKDAVMTPEQYVRCYMQTLKMMWRMYHRCKLIHADLSEYNILFYNNRVYFIDVSQSVEHDHPNALQFLRKDISNVTDFFGRNGAVVMNNRELFDFVTRLDLPEENVESYINNILDDVRSRPAQSEQEKVTEAVFMQSFIPRTLDEVIDYRRDINKIGTGDDDDLLYKTLTGLNITMEQEQRGNEESSEDEDEDDDDNSEESGDDDEESEGSEVEGEEKRERRVKRVVETPEEKKARKQQVKQEARKRRETKIPKSVKKRRKKIAKGANKNNK